MKIFQARISINSCILKAYIFVFARNVSGQQVFEPFSTTSIFWGCILISGYSLQPTNYGRRRTTCNMLPSSLPTAGCRSATSSTAPQLASRDGARQHRLSTKFRRVCLAITDTAQLALRGNLPRWFASRCFIKIAHLLPPQNRESSRAKKSL